MILVADATAHRGRGRGGSLEALRSVSAPAVLALEQGRPRARQGQAPAAPRGLRRSAPFRALVPVSAKTGHGRGPARGGDARAPLPPARPLYPADTVDRSAGDAVRRRDHPGEALPDAASGRCRTPAPSGSRRSSSAGRTLRSTSAARSSSSARPRRGIVIGEGGAMLKRVGQAARRELEAFFGVRRLPRPPRARPAGLAAGRPRACGSSATSGRPEGTMPLLRTEGIVLHAVGPRRARPARRPLHPGARPALGRRARRARGSARAFAGALELFTWGRRGRVRARGRALVRLDHFDIREPFRRLRDDPECLGQGARYDRGGGAAHGRARRAAALLRAAAPGTPARSTRAPRRPRCSSPSPSGCSTFSATGPGSTGAGAVAAQSAPRASRLRRDRGSRGLRALPRRPAPLAPAVAAALRGSRRRRGRRASAPGSRPPSSRRPPPCWDDYLASADRGAASERHASSPGRAPAPGSG